MDFYIKVCESFLREHKKVFDETKLCLKYRETIIALEKKAKEIIIYNDRYSVDEMHYMNRGVNMNIHSSIADKNEELFHILSDIEYFKQKISTLAYDEDVYESYVRCENDLHFHKLNNS